MRPPLSIVVLAIAVSGPRGAAAQALTPAQEERVDLVFSDLERAGPGASAAVVRGGVIVYSKGFGLAQVEHGVPVTPSTVFHVASVSKQFTAMGVALLEAGGRLSLDDDVRMHLPAVPAFGPTVTVRHVLNHTSGIRDQWQLLALAGWRLDDVITKEHVRALLSRQRELNFEPGSEYLYSNMGYSLAADLVEQVSGRPFGDFLAERVFLPLGMNRTHVHDDHEMVVPGRAYSYRPDGDGYRKAVLSYANHGATSLFTTAEDLARWLDNFRTARVGGRAVLDRLTTRAVLNDGDTISYGLGVSVSEYRGATTFGHGGSDAGFRSNVMWVPEHETGIVVLSNLATANPGARARAIADVVLADQLAPVAPPDRADADAPDAEPEPPTPPGEPAEYEGTYYAPELETLYRIEARGSALVARHIRHGEIDLAHEEGDRFRGDRWFMGEVRFTRNPEGRVDGMRVGGGRVRDLRFVRLAAELPGG